MTTSRAINFKGMKNQKGNYLLSIGMGIMVMAILAVWGIPKIKDYLIEGAIPSVSEEAQRFIARIKVNTSGSGVEPYDGLDQAFFARSVRGSSLQVAASGGGASAETVRHGLGGGDTGTIVLTENNSSFTLTFNNVNQAACPSLATAMQRAVDAITINGQSVKATNTSNNVTTEFKASSAAVHCTNGDSNVFAFIVNS